MEVFPNLTKLGQYETPNESEADTPTYKFLFKQYPPIITNYNTNIESYQMETTKQYVTRVLPQVELINNVLEQAETDQHMTMLIQSLITMNVYPDRVVSEADLDQFMRLYNAWIRKRPKPKQERESILWIMSQKDNMINIPSQAL